jgi:predicted nuclease of predicted toxin-antitoxin system
MKLLLDECVPARLRNHIPGHNVSTVPREGWAGIKNGQLLSLAAAADFEALVTIRRGDAAPTESDDVAAGGDHSSRPVQLD